MKQEMVTISKKEYEHLKSLEAKESELLKMLEDALADVKAGRIRRVV